MCTFRVYMIIKIFCSHSVPCQLVNSGACACVARFEGSSVHVANVGDCAALIGRQDDEGQWQAVELSNCHNTDNPMEVTAPSNKQL